MKIKFLLPLLILIGVTVVISCSKANNDRIGNTTKGKLEFRLRDDPYTFAYFKIDFDKLEYNTSADPTITTGWVEIPLQTRGVIDIIQYSNGRELPLGSLELLPAAVRLLRLKFGTRNS